MVEDTEQCFSHLRCHRCCRWSECWYASIALPEVLCFLTMCACFVMTGYFLADHFIAAAHNMNMVPGAAPASSMGATGLAIGLVLLALLFAGSDPYAALTIVDGRVRVRDGHVVDVDELRALDGLNTASNRLIVAAQKRTGIDFSRQT